MKYFIDSNIIIDLLHKKEDAINRISSIIAEDNSELYINRLVYLECLRTEPFQNKRIFENAKVTLNNFEKLDITQKIYDEAINLSRYCLSKGLTLKGKCAAIDFIHFMTAKHYNLEIISNDGDFNEIEKKYLELVNC